MKKIVEQLLKAEDIAIISHIAPDGDTVGSSVALGVALSRLGKSVALFCDDPIPHTYENITALMPYSTKLPDKPFSLAIAVDCADIKRVGRAMTLMEQAGVTCNLDHHRSNPGFAQYNYIDGEASSASELMVEVVELLGVALDEKLALCLYSGISSDTGNFAYTNTTPKSMRTAARLLETGIDVFDINSRLFRSKTLENVWLLQKTINNMEVRGKFVISHLSLEDLEACHGTPADCDSLVDYLRDIENIEVAVLVRQMTPERCKLSMRSKYLVDMAALAQSFGGGGHLRAAGCSIPGSIEHAKAEIIRAVEAVL